MNIVEAIKENTLLRPFLEDRAGRLDTWMPWITALKCIYGLPTTPSRHDLIRQCTGREPDLLPSSGFSTVLLLTGRRSGKSRIAATIGAYEAVLARHERKLSKGERGVVAICAPTKHQGRIVKDYLRSIFDTPLLRPEVQAETKNGFHLRGRTSIEILAGDFRTVRGFTTYAVICDEIAYMGIDDDGKVRSDTELIRAIKPSLATIGGKLIAISSPYARKGWTWKTYEKNWGNDNGTALVWNCPSRTLNPTLPQKVVDEAMAEDRQAALAEFYGQFRDDVGEFISRAVIQGLVQEDRAELMPRDGVKYFGFADVSGGRGDDAALAIAHKQGRKVVLDLIRRYRPPFSPYEVCGSMAKELRRFGIKRIVGDNYAAEYTSSAMSACGLRYERAEKNVSQLYLELLPRLCSGEIELLDDETLINQLASLERRTRSGGKDVISHPRGGHDDLANAVAGVCDVAFAARSKVGTF